MSRGSIREAVVAAKAAIIRRMLSDMETLPLATLQAFLADPRMVAAGESYLRRALEALLDLGRHILAKGFAVAATEFKEIPRQLRAAGVLDEAQNEVLTRMAGYRNRLVHVYEEVTPEELYRILTGHRDDIRAILDTLRAWLEDHPGQRDPQL